MKSKRTRRTTATTAQSPRLQLVETRNDDNHVVALEPKWDVGRRPPLTSLQTQEARYA